MHPLPNQYKGKAYTAVLLTLVHIIGDSNNYHYVAYTANHCDISGEGATRPEAINDLRERILERINFDIEQQRPVEFCVDVIPQMSNPFIVSLLEQLNGDDRIYLIQAEVIKLTPFH